MVLKGAMGEGKYPRGSAWLRKAMVIHKKRVVYPTAADNYFAPQTE